MTNTRNTPMSKILETMRLHGLCLNKTQIASAVKLGRRAVREIIERAEKQDLNYDKLKQLAPHQIYSQLYPASQTPKTENKPAFDPAYVHSELKNPKVHLTLTLLWEEYMRENPNGYRYTQFCHIYNTWKKHLDITMRQTHVFGEKMFVDFCGDTVPILDPTTNEVHFYAHIFVAVLGASNYTYATARKGETSRDWVESQVEALEYFHGSPKIIVPDNPKPVITKHCKWEPAINRTYREMAEYYNLVVLPARVRKPKDKAKVEAAVLLVERWILAALRHRHFYSLGELNEEIGVLLERLNDKKFKKLQGSRKELFEKNERPVLRALPTERYSYGEWKIAKVNIDYHIEIDRSYYSVPYKYIGRKLDVRVSSATLDIYSQMTHICSHVLALRDGSHITIKEHMPKSHQEYGHWTPERIISWAESLGEDAGLYVKKLLHSQKHPALGYRKALGIISLKKIYSSEKINQACKRANSFGANDYQTVKRILEKNLQDDTAHINKSETIPSQEHENVRGNQYYE